MKKYLIEKSNYWSEEDIKKMFSLDKIFDDMEIKNNSDFIILYDLHLSNEEHEMYKKWMALKD